MPCLLLRSDGCTKLAAPKLDLSPMLMIKTWLGKVLIAVINDEATDEELHTPRRFSRGDGGSAALWPLRCAAARRRSAAPPALWRCAATMAAAQPPWRCFPRPRERRRKMQGRPLPHKLCARLRKMPADPCASSRRWADVYGICDLVSGSNRPQATWYICPGNPGAV